MVISSKIKSWQAFLITLGLLLVGYIVKTAWAGAPFGEYSIALTTIYAGYLAKRTVQKLEKFGGTCPPQGGTE